MNTETINSASYMQVNKKELVDLILKTFYDNEVGNIGVIVTTNFGENENITQTIHLSKPLNV